VEVRFDEHILCRLAQEGTLCFGAREGKQPTFALLAEWVPKPRKLAREAALAELAERYFISHGPATLQDFAGWSGLKMSDARDGVGGVASRLARQTVGNQVYWMSRDLPDLSGVSKTSILLPGFDEYLLGYKDRGAVLPARHASRIVPGANGIFQPTIVIDGQVAGVWKRVLKKREVTVAISAFVRFKKADRKLIVAAAKRYGQFLGLPGVRLLDH
jgi:hypothetical protein